ncbi:MAG TPA: hypothetical protein VI854_02980 [Acidimicrobiia bacterium]|nr:hypothetical protein [Acidimicrobiia bacterium]
MTFYDEVLRELLVALGAALFLGNLLALVRRRPPRSMVEDAGDRDEVLVSAPLGRTIAYLLIGFVVMLWGIASLAVG